MSHSLWLPPEAAHEREQRRFLRRLDQFADVVDEAAPKLVAVPNLEGYREHTAAALVVRGIELLRSCLAAGEGADEVVLLGARSVFEIACRGRFLLVAPGRENEFGRMAYRFAEWEAREAERVGQTPPGLPSTLVDSLPTRSSLATKKGAIVLKDLYAIATGLDSVDGYAEEDQFSSRQGHRIIYGWLSEAATHAGLGALRRHTTTRDGMLSIVPSPPPLTTGYPLVVAATWLGEAAVEVFKVFQIGVQPLVELGISRPPRPST